MLRVQLLGEVAVERDGTAVALSPPNRRLLAFLAVRGGPHDRDALAARFWPDARPASARANLRTAVWTLKAVLGADAVVATRSTAGLCSDGLSVDVDELAARAEQGDAEAAAALGAAEPCAGIDEDWARDARAGHLRRRIELLDRLAGVAEAGGDHAAAARWSGERCASTPLDEPAHRDLIGRLAAAGDPAAALLVGRDLAGRLRSELGVTPAPATRALLARLRGPAARGRVASGRRPLFGRARELGVLGAAWAAARDGAGRVVLVTGEAGIGKTRLVEELARRAENAGARVAVGAGVDVGGEAPLAVWQELARALVALIGPPPDTAGWPAELGRLAPDLAVALGRRGAPPGVAAPELERLRLFDAVLRLVEWAAVGRPVLLVAEDVHRADRASLALCSHIGRRLAGLPVLFVLTRRDRPTRPDADALLADVAGRGVDVEEIELEPLDDRELAEVARSAAPLDDDDVQRIVAAAEGSPLLAVASARALASGSSSSPPSLRALVRASLGALAPPARELAEVLAAAGRALSAAEVAALDAPDGTEPAVLDSGLVGRAAGGLRFRHALLAEAARADLRDPEHSHLRVARAVESAAGPDEVDGRAAEVARHLQRAGRAELAGPRWQRAGRHARSVGALPEAAAFWTEAVRCDPDAAGPRLELAEVQGWLGRPAEFERGWEEALARLAPHEQPAAWCRRGLMLQTVVCNPMASLEAYRRADQLLPADAPAALRAQVALGLAWDEAIAGDPARSDRLLVEVDRLVPEPDDATIGEIETTRVVILIRTGRFAECEAVAERGGAAIDRAARPDLAYVLWIMAACGLACAGDLEGALRAADRGITATHGVPVVTLACLAARAHLLARLARHAEALGTSAQQQAVAERLDSPALIALARHDAGLVALGAGDHRAAAGLLAAALDGGAAVSRPATRLARAEALAACGDPDAAAAELRRAALEPVGRGDQPGALVPRLARVQGLIARARGDAGGARLRLTESADGWRRRLAVARSAAGTGEEYMAVLVDLGRPPVVGLVEPEWELARVLAELETVEVAGCRGSS